jgi:16S rRNA (uracil1498-N3)-methyltransferase
MTGERPKIRLYVEGALDRGASVGLSRAQAHYLTGVMRLKTGGQVALFNGRDGEWRARIDGAGRGWCSLMAEEKLRDQAEEPDLWLLFAPVKRTRVDFIAQKATELGVSRLVPVFTRYTQVERVNVERLAANAVEAAEQSGRLTVPEIAEPMPLEPLLADWPAERHILLCDESGTAPGAVTTLRDAEKGPWAVLIGPEGGFAPQELEASRRLAHVTPISLGPRILRADTAVISALTLWQALLGDWRA